jgi:hypothetical protein
MAGAEVRDAGTVALLQHLIACLVAAVLPCTCILANHRDEKPL